MPFDFGPEPIQFSGYGGRKPLQHRKLATAQEFYDATRSRSRQGFFSALCILLPFAPFAMALGLAAYLQNGWSLTSDADPKIQRDAAEALFKTFCASSVSGAATADALFGALAHFSASQITFVCASLLTFLGAAVSARNVLKIHEARRPGTLAVAGPVLGSLAILGAGYVLFGDLIRKAFDGLDVIPVGQAFPCLQHHAADVLDRLAVSAYWGVWIVILAVAGLMAAAAALAYRYEIDDVNGAWADTYILRHKLKSLLTLFFLGSVLLVSSNIALGSLSNVPLAIVGEAVAAQAKEAPPADRSPCVILCFGDATPAAKDGAGSPPPDFAAAETVAQVKSLRSELLFASGVLGSLLLVAIFAPAFYGLTGEIQIAGKTHAARPRPTAGAGSYPVAGYEEVGKWRDKHGLAVTFPQLTGSLVAVLAPVLSGGLLDVGKTLLSG